MCVFFVCFSLFFFQYMCVFFLIVISFLKFILDKIRRGWTVTAFGKALPPLAHGCIRVSGLGTKTKLLFFLSKTGQKKSNDVKYRFYHFYEYTKQKLQSFLDAL